MASPISLNSHRWLDVPASRRGMSVPDKTGVLGILARSIGGVREHFAQRRRYRTTVNELSALGDRELADIGLRRADIEFVARRTAVRG